jgi:NAD(P)-dependent dehydrogenase (short-subunit alcohol dehydrogenase family)
MHVPFRSTCAYAYILDAERWESMPRHEGRVALVTGAGSGMGAAMCELFLREGAKVVAADITGVDDAKARWGDGAVGVLADVTRAEDVSAAVDTALERFGRLDVMCNNAGITLPPTPLHQIAEADYDRVQDINAKGVFLGMKYGIPAILAGGRGGAVVNTASTSSVLALPGRAAYSGSKGSVAMLTKSAAVDYAAQGVRVNAICPGPTRTGIFDAAIRNIPDVEARMAVTVPMARICEPSEIASVASFLASDEASFVTGAIVTVDGGMSCVHPH